MQDELLLKIRVHIQEAVSVEGAQQKIVMIPFTGEAEGPCFTGKVVGNGVDTQKIDRDGHAVISARYMMEGKDAAGNACRVFVENEGSWDTGFRPVIVTDSPLLAGWETAEQYATLDDIPGGVLVSIYKKYSIGRKTGTVPG